MIIWPGWLRTGWGRVGDSNPFLFWNGSRSRRKREANCLVAVEKQAAGCSLTRISSCWLHGSGRNFKPVMLTLGPLIGAVLFPCSARFSLFFPFVLFSI